MHESRVLEIVDHTCLDGIPVTTAARTIFDLISVRGSSTVDLAIDSALRRGLVSLDELASTLARLTRRGRAGVAAFRELLDQRSSLAETESEGEQRLLRLIVRLGLPRPVTQYEIRDDDGHVVARVDFAYPDLKIAIEYDSYAHHVGKAALVRDGARRNAIVSLGWLPITATAADLRDGGRRLAVDVRRARALRTGGGTRE